MNTEAVSNWLENIRTNDELRYQFVQAVRDVILQSGNDITEEIKYGGILFSKDGAFCGLFSYTAHISLEFGNGAELPDTYRVLEGKGKGRRHIKLAGISDVESKHVKYYVGLAYASSN
jgi:hypothetical protein